MEERVPMTSDTNSGWSTAVSHEFLNSFLCIIRMSLICCVRDPSVSPQRKPQNVDMESRENFEYGLI